jgi:hypothetical protein
LPLDSRRRRHSTIVVSPQLSSAAARGIPHAVAADVVRRASAATTPRGVGSPGVASGGIPSAAAATATASANDGGRRRSSVSVADTFAFPMRSAALSFSASGGGGGGGGGGLPSAINAPVDGVRSPSRAASHRHLRVSAAVADRAAPVVAVEGRGAGHLSLVVEGTSPTTALSTHDPLPVQESLSWGRHQRRSSMSIAKQRALRLLRSEDKEDRQRVVLHVTSSRRDDPVASV